MQIVDNRLPRILSWVLAGVFAVVPVWTFAAVSLGHFVGYYEVWRVLPSVVIFLVAVVAVIAALLWQRQLIKSFLRDKITLLILAFALVMLISAILGEATLRAKLAGLAMDGRFLVAFLAARWLAFSEPKLWRSFLDFAPKFLVIVGVGLSILGLIQVTWLPKEFLTVFGYSLDGVAPYVSIDHGETLRAFATMAGPNNYANYLLITLFAAVFLIIRGKGRWRRLAIMSVPIIASGLAVSSSRAAWLATIVALVTYFVLNHKISRKVIVGSAIGVVVIGLVSLALFEVPAFRENILHIRDDRDSAVVTSNDAHLDALVDGVDQVVETPLGCGVGCAGPASYYSVRGIISENYYLQIAQEYGFIGIALFAWMLTLILLRLRQDKEDHLAQIWLAAGIGLLFAALFAHTFADEAVSVTWFMLAGGLIGASRPRAVRP